MEYLRVKDVKWVCKLVLSFLSEVMLQKYSLVIHHSSLVIMCTNCNFIWRPIYVKRHFFVYETGVDRIIKFFTVKYCLIKICFNHTKLYTRVHLINVLKKHKHLVLGYTLCVITPWSMFFSWLIVACFLKTRRFSNKPSNVPPGFTSARSLICVLLTQWPILASHRSRSIQTAYVFDFAKCRCSVGYPRYDYSLRQSVTYTCSHITYFLHVAFYKYHKLC